MKFPSTCVVPLCGPVDEPLPSGFGPMPDPQQASGNKEAWHKYFLSVRAFTPRERKRALYEFSQRLIAAQVSDLQVVALAGVFCRSLPVTDVTREVAELCDLIVGSARQGLLESGNTVQWEALRRLVSIKVDPDSYQDPESYFWDVSAIKLLSKYPFKGAEEVAKDVAIRKLLQQEGRNAQTNARWIEGNFDPQELVLIGRVQRELGDILGPPPSVDEILDLAAWGPGTLVGFNFEGDLTGAEFKFWDIPTCTPQLQPVAKWVLSSYPPWWRSVAATWGPQGLVRVVTGDELFTVPKRFEEHRCAIKQPSVNAWLQRGIGRFISQRLLVSGVDLAKQQSRNRHLAQIGSVTGLLATLDLTSASDSMTRAVLRSVLDPGWAAWVASTTATHFYLPLGYTLPDGYKRRVKYQMACAMGCGFTFELETALFLAIVRSIVPGMWLRSHGFVDGVSVRPGVKLSWAHVGVNGDDIIVPTAYAQRVMEALKLFGFNVNEQKSFYNPNGRFRESCGGDYFRGVSVRPFFLTKELVGGDQIQTTCNALLDKAAEVGDQVACYPGSLHSNYAGLWRALQAYLPSGLRQVNSSPPGTPGGLWIPWLCEWERPSGLYPFYKVLTVSSEKVDLTDLVGTLKINQSTIVAPLDGENLLAARLGGLGSDPADTSPFVKPPPLGVGMYAVRRGGMAKRVTLLRSTPVLGRRWSGWR